MSSSREPRVGGGVGRTTEDESARPLGVFQGRAIGDREYAGSGRNRVLFFSLPLCAFLGTIRGR